MTQYRYYIRNEGYYGTVMEFDLKRCEYFALISVRID